MTEIDRSREDISMTNVTPIVYDGTESDTTKEWLGENFKAWADDKTISVTFADGFEATVHEGDRLRRAADGGLEIWHGPNHT